MKAAHRLRLSHIDARYGGDLVAGGRLMELVGDVATELCIRCDGDEGLLAAYSSVDFLAPVYAGDFVEVIGEITARGRSSRAMEFSILKYARRRRDVSDSAADVLDEPEVVLRASATCVVKSADQRKGKTC